MVDTEALREKMREVGYYDKPKNERKEIEGLIQIVLDFVLVDRTFYTHEEAQRRQEMRSTILEGYKKISDSLSKTMKVEYNNQKRQCLRYFSEVIDRIDGKADESTNRSPSKRMRYLILDRDNFTCTYCGRSAPQVVLHIDHIVPWSKGGPTTESNLTTSCSDCNLGKSDLLLTEGNE